MSEILMAMPLAQFSTYLRKNFSYSPDDLEALGNKFRQLLIATEADSSAQRKLLEIQSFWRLGWDELPDRTGSKEPPDPGVLKAVGYYVSGSTLSRNERRAVLHYVMTGDDLPPIKDKAHMREWGAARSIDRMAKLERDLKFFSSKFVGNRLQVLPRSKWDEDYAFVIENAASLLSPSEKRKRDNLLARFKESNAPPPTN